MGKSSSSWGHEKARSGRKTEQKALCELKIKKGGGVGPMRGENKRPKKLRGPLNDKKKKERSHPSGWEAGGGRIKVEFSEK